MHLWPRCKSKDCAFFLWFWENEISVRIRLATIEVTYNIIDIDGNLNIVLQDLFNKIIYVIFKIDIHLESTYHIALQWHRNEHDGVANHQLHQCLLERLFWRRSKKTSKLHVTGLCEGNSPVAGEFPAQMASNADNVSIWWRHHGLRVRVCCGYVFVAIFICTCILLWTNDDYLLFFFLQNLDTILSRHIFRSSVLRYTPLFGKYDYGHTCLVVILWWVIGRRNCVRCKV